MAAKTSARGRGRPGNGYEVVTIVARLRADQAAALRETQQTTGIPIVEQIRRGVDQWLRGPTVAAAARPRRARA
jgi:hypothetical protein